MPAAARTVTILVSDDIATTHDFLVNTFGFEPGRVEQDDDGAEYSAYDCEGQIWSLATFLEQPCQGLLVRGLGLGGAASPTEQIGVLTPMA